MVINIHSSLVEQALHDRSIKTQSSSRLISLEEAQKRSRSDLLPLTSIGSKITVSLTEDSTISCPSTGYHTHIELPRLNKFLYFLINSLYLNCYVSLCYFNLFNNKLINY